MRAKRTATAAEQTGEKKAGMVKECEYSKLPWRKQLSQSLFKNDITSF